MKFLKIIVLILLTISGAANSNLILANNSVELKKTIGFDEERKIFELINRERNKKGRQSLIWNSKLADLARSYSEKMARERFFSHFDRDGKDVAQRAKAMRITKWRLIGENLFMSEPLNKIPESAVKGWMKSPTHRENILEENFNETGIGVARSRDGMIYITQVFVQN